MRRILVLGITLLVLLFVFVLRGCAAGHATATLFKKYAAELTTMPEPVRYDLLKQALVLKKAPNALRDMQETDRYYQLEYEFLFPFISDFTEGKTGVSGRYIDGYTLAREGGGLKIIFHERNITAFEVTEDMENIYIRPIHPQECYDRVVLLDPGHGGKDEGAASKTGIIEWNGDNRLVEKDYNLALAHKVAERLEDAPGLKAYLTRVDDVFISLDKRRETRDYLGGLFVSLHVNASEYPAKNGLWTYYCDNTIPLSYDSRMFALDMLYTLADVTGYTSYDIDSERFAVLRDSVIPAVLVEAGFLTNIKDLQRLVGDGFIDKLAEGVSVGILDGFEQMAE